MIQDLKKQRLKIVIWSTAVIQDLPSSIISRDGHFTILQFVTKQIWTQIPDTDMNMGRRWKKYMPSLTLYQRFSTGGNSWRCEMQCLGAAVLWVAPFRGFSTRRCCGLLWEDDDGWSNQETKAVSPLCAFCNMDNWKFRGKSGNRWEMLASQGVLRAI